MTRTFPNPYKRYLRKVTTLPSPSSAPIPASVSQCQFSPRWETYRLIHRFYFSAAAFIPPDHESLVLHDIHQLVDSFESISDSMVHEIKDGYDASTFVPIENPNFVLLISSQEDPCFSKAVIFLKKQRSLSLVLDGYYPERDKSLGFQLLAAVFGTENFVFVFDWKKITEIVMLTILKPILEDIEIHKIVYRFRLREEWLETNFGIKAVNCYDVYHAEQKLEKSRSTPPLKNYSILEFAKRYQDHAKCFKKLPPEDFSARPLEVESCIFHPHQKSSRLSIRCYGISWGRCFIYR